MSQHVLIVYGRRLSEESTNGGKYMALVLSFVDVAKISRSEWVGAQ